MRATVHQTLTSEAAAVLRNAVGLARRRGHAQATPLHVAATLLASETSLLRHACLHSHGGAAAGGGVPPLQWRALEVCFNVALNRLPAAVHQGQPSLSNALIAALKRAQAHQRRGCIEQQQAQPLLGVKVEMEQLVISILDDPSVSRVMREAGFYTTHVKNSVEDTLGSTNSACTNLSSIIRYNTSSEGITGTRRIPPPWSINQRQDYAKPPDLCLVRRLNPPSGAAVDSLDMKSLVETLVSQKMRKNTIIVGDEPLYTKSIVRELMIRIQSGNVPDDLKSAQFIAPQIFSCALSLDKDDVDRKVAELNRITSNCCNGRVIAYVGDLRWTVETGQGYYNSTSFYSYSPVEHVIVEVGRMLASYGDKLCLVGTATHGTYMQCKMRQPCLESQWKLQPLNVSSGGLSLALQSSALRPEDAKVDLGEVCISNTLEFHKLKASTSDNDIEKLNCCSDYSANFELKAHFQDQNLWQQTSTKLPCWLRQYKEAETCTVDSASPQALRASEMVGDLREKWDQNCGLIYEQQQQDIHFSCTSNMGENAMLHDSKLQQQLDASKVCWNSTVKNPSWSNCSIMRSFSPQTSIENSSKKIFEEESPSESDQNRSRLEVETALTLGRSSSGDHDNNKILDKRYSRPSNEPLWTQSTANSPESLSASVGNVSFC